VIYKLQKVKK